MHVSDPQVALCQQSHNEGDLKVKRLMKQFDEPRHKSRAFACPDIFISVQKKHTYIVQEIVLRGRGLRLNLIWVSRGPGTECSLRSIDLDLEARRLKSKVSVFAGTERDNSVDDAITGAQGAFTVTTARDMVET